MIGPAMPVPPIPAGRWYALCVRPPREDPMARLTLKVTGMTCGHCQKRVETALSQVPGVFAAVVDLQDGVAEVDYDDDAATIEELTAAVARAGYAAALDG